MTATLLHGDCRDILPTLPSSSVQTCVTSPPYWGLRDYGVAGQIGMEPALHDYVAALVAVFREVRRVLRGDGTLWLNLGDGYAMDRKWGGRSGGKNYTSAAGALPRERKRSGLADKQLLGIPWRVAFALQDDGWILRSDCIWHKPNAMPESVKDRPTRAHEYIFLFAARARYYYDADAIAEPAVNGDAAPPSGARRGRPNAGRRERARDYDRAAAQYGDATSAARRGAGGVWLRETRNKRSVWTVSTSGYDGAHFAVFPEALIVPCILAGSRPGDTVLDPFAGSGTTLRVAERFGRDSIGIDLNESYLDLQRQRTNGVQREMVEVRDA